MTWTKRDLAGFEVEAPDAYRDQAYRDRIGSYYAVGGAGYRDQDVL